MASARVFATISFAAIAALAAHAARADGCYFSPEEQDLLEPTQIGLIVHDAAASREDLYLQVDFQESSGAAIARMGWILALPSVPQVAEADEKLFVELMNMTRPYEDDDAFGDGCSEISRSSGGMGEGGAQIDAVEIESRQVVGAFDVTTVASESVAPLEAWLSERGFAMKDGAAEILQFYVDKAWHFVAIDVDLAEARADGFLPPIELSFDTPRAVFPLRISAINGLGGAGGDTDEEYLSEEYTGVLLYALASRPLTIEGEDVTPEFVHSIDGADLSAYPAVDAALPGAGYLVKLRLDKAAGQMTDDLTLVPISSTAAIVAGRRGGFDAAWIAVGLLLLGGAVKKTRRQERSRG
jgi:hypothetical protein